MSEIKPVVAPDLWAHFARFPDFLRERVAEGCDRVLHDLKRDPAALMALANAALPDDHPGKLTWAHVDALRECAEFTGGPEADKTTEAAAIVASLLPPREDA